MDGLSNKSIATEKNKPQKIRKQVTRNVSREDALRARTEQRMHRERNTATDRRTTEQKHDDERSI